MTNCVFIYELIDPRTDKTRYIGKTNNIKRRLREHNVKSKKKYHKTNWLNELHDNNLKPIINVIDIVEEKDWEFWERWWIELYLSWNLSLVNTSKGGDCGPISKGSKNGMFGKTHSKEAIKKISESKKKLVGKLHPQFGKQSKLKGLSYEQIVGVEKSNLLKLNRSQSMKKRRVLIFSKFEIINHNTNEKYYNNDCSLLKFCKENNFHYWTLFYGIDKGILNKGKQRFHLNWSIKSI